MQRTVSVEQKSAWLREANGGTTQPVTGVLSTRYYSVKDIADLLSLSQDSIRKLFQDEPGVFTLGSNNPRGRRGYTTLRIPEEVALRVWRARGGSV